MISAFFFLPFNKAPIFSVPFQTTKPFPNVSEEIKGGTEQGVGGAEGTHGPGHGQGELKADSRPEQVSSEEQEASQWVGCLEQRKDRENLCGHIAGEMADQTKVCKRRIAGRIWVWLRQNVPSGKELIFLKK